MNVHDFAKKLDGREYLKEITKEEIKQAEELGYVVVFGYSDDNAEFRGAIDEEVGCYDGGVILIDKNCIFEECECECKYSKAAKKGCKVVEALWCPDDDYSWRYKTDIPHAEFDVLEDGELFCRGIVFDIKELQ